MTFTNTGCESVSIYYDNGVRTFYYTSLHQGDSWTVSTFIGHVWRFAGWNGSSSSWVVNSCSDQTHEIKTRDKIQVTNSTDCEITVFCHEWSQDGQIYNMGTLDPGEVVYVFPSAETAYIYTENEDDEEINGIWTDGNDPCYDVNFLNCLPGGGGLLPIELIEFKAKVIDNKTVQLGWITGTEIDNDYFLLERSKDLRTWQLVDLQAGAGTTTAQQFYKTVDVKPHAGVNYYRLKQVDYDGAFEYFDVISVNLESSKTDFLSIFPNPSSDYIQLNVEQPEQVKIYTISGQSVAFNIDEGSNSIDVSSFKEGLYLIEVFKKGEGSQIKKFTVNRN